MFWIILLALIIICGGGIYLSSGYEYAGLGFSMVATAGTILAIFLLIWPINYMESVSMVSEYQALNTTIESARANGVDALERVALQKEIIDMNKNIQTSQYWNTNGFDVLYSDKIMQLELLK